jgi:hypothetical protein
VQFIERTTLVQGETSSLNLGHPHPLKLVVSLSTHHLLQHRWHHSPDSGHDIVYPPPSALKCRTVFLRLQHDFDASIFFVAKGLVTGRCFFQGQTMSDDKGGVDFASFDFLQKRSCVALDMCLSGFDG